MPATSSKDCWDVSAHKLGVLQDTAGSRPSKNEELKMIYGGNRYFLCRHLNAGNLSNLSQYLEVTFGHHPWNLPCWTSLENLAWKFFL